MNEQEKNESDEERRVQASEQAIREGVFVVAVFFNVLFALSLAFSFPFPIRAQNLADS